MQFNSITFLFVFLPVFLAVYYIAPAKIKNTVLLLSSILFYGIGIGWQILPMALLLGITVLTYFAGRALKKPHLRIVFWITIVAMLMVLVFFKCWAGGKYLPAGMSFYLFQIAAYLICVYGGRMEPEKDVISYGAEVMMFPKVLSGPLMEPGTLAQQTHVRKLDLANFHKGLQQLILGLGLKVIIANRIGGLWNQASVVGYESISPIFAWMCLIAYAMKLYFDFFGYSVMAMGLGRMMGFTIPENFIDPYASRSVSEFYRRWHITLGAWFREYIYIPLGGNRKGMGRTIINLLIVWALTGLWHGIGGNYLLWAGIIAAFIILERVLIGKWLKKSYILCHIYTVFIILLSWVPFAIGDWGQMGIYFGRLFGTCGHTLNLADYVYWMKEYAVLLISGAVLMTPVPRFVWKKIEECWIADVICFVLFWVSVYFISTAAQDPFMYFQY